MRISEFAEKNKEKYACMDYMLANGDVYDLHNQKLTEDDNDIDINGCDVVDMDMYQYILYLESENWKDFDRTDEEQKESIEAINAEKYEYSKDDKFVVIFARQ